MNPTASTKQAKLTKMEAKSLPRAKAITILTSFGYSVVNFTSGKDLVEGVPSKKSHDWFVRQMRGFGVYLIHVEGGYIIQNR